jgi:hypothetical protein
MRGYLHASRTIPCPTEGFKDAGEGRHGPASSPDVRAFLIPWLAGGAEDIRGREKRTRSYFNRVRQLLKMLTSCPSFVKCLAIFIYGYLKKYALSLSLSSSIIEFIPTQGRYGKMSKKILWEVKGRIKKMKMFRILGKGSLWDFSSEKRVSWQT